MSKRYAKGERLRHEDVNRLLELADAVRSLRGDTFIHVEETPQGRRVSLDIDAVALRIPKRHLGFWARLTASAADGDRWTYTFVEVAKKTVGYGGWAVVAGGLTGTARNTAEDPTGDYVAVPTNTVVWMRRADISGDSEFWFTSYTELPDGTEANQVLVWNNTDKVWEAGRVKAY